MIFMYTKILKKPLKSAIKIIAVGYKTKWTEKSIVLTLAQQIIQKNDIRKITQFIIALKRIKY